MAAYSLEIWRSGYTEDVYYYDFSGCLSEAVRTITGLPDSDPRLDSGEYTTEDGKLRYTWRQLSSFETDCDVWCKGCGDFMQHGLECECEDPTTDREPLTEAQLKTL